MRASLKEVAKAAGVSEATASLAINNRPGVSAKTRERVREIAKNMGYIASVSAQNLATRKSGLIGLIVPNLSNVVYSALVMEVETQLRQRGYKMIMSSSENNVDYERAMIEHFISFRVEGAIIYPLINENPDPSYINLLTRNDIPYLFLGGYYQGIKASHVMSDIYGAVGHAAEYLYQRGGRRFYYFGGCYKRTVSNILKSWALRDILGQHGIAFTDDHYIELGYNEWRQSNYENAYKKAKQLFTSTEVVDSIIASDAYTALAVYNALADNGMQVPQDVSMINFDNVVPPGVCKIPLTCIEQDIVKMVSLAIEELFKKMEGNKVEKNILVDTKLIVRNTTR